ncbi:hypothetical protein E0H26_11830 [Micromonospora zingiberis]|uniref:Uncharacterized protein n=1 Tax=Micromonospora zingiberis TaxID=2053011 RepID=A0A4R0GJH3_9ACTN|nr:hypothetical protein [Micromonospora zingiberis]TCB97600.1 hypothetical protein E0H26_11830 [Micromonospora zingiberis]
MTSMYDEPPLIEVEQAAAVIVARHRDGRCDACTPHGCPELARARPVHTRAEQRWLAAARDG